jgi:hypothetical protein
MFADVNMMMFLDPFRNTSNQLIAMMHIVVAFV